jgi:hypothetical protein
MARAIKKTAKQVEENVFIPVKPHIMKCAKFWRGQSLRGDLMDKGGSFNIELYLRYLEAQLA